MSKSATEPKEGSRPKDRIFTIGHSNNSIEHFLSLLEQHNIDVVVDVRSSPFSKFANQFNKQNLDLSIANARKKYLFLGRELGGMPKDDIYYDDEGFVLYWKIAESELFQHAISRICKGIASYTVALMCGEENPSNCHRRLLVGRVLNGYGAELLHIRGSGLVQTDDELEDDSGRSARQLNIFAEPNEQKLWRSSQPVAVKKRQIDSSAPSEQ